MSRRATSYTPVAHKDKAVWWEGDERQECEIDSQQWYGVLEHIGKISFMPFSSWNGTKYQYMTCRKEIRRGKDYWYAYMKRDKTTHKRYIGKAEAMTYGKLCKVWWNLIEPDQHPL